MNTLGGGDYSWILKEGFDENLYSHICIQVNQR